MAETVDYEGVRVGADGLPDISDVSSSPDPVKDKDSSDVELDSDGLPRLGDPDSDSMSQKPTASKRARKLKFKFSNCSLDDKSDSKLGAGTESSESEVLETPTKREPPSRLSDLERLTNQAQDVAKKVLPKSRTLKPPKPKAVPKAPGSVPIGPSGKAFGTTVGESKSFGTVKLCCFSEKSYILKRDPETKRWPSLIGFYALNLKETHQEVSTFLFEHILDHECNISSLKALRDRVAQDSNLQTNKQKRAHICICRHRCRSRDRHILIHLVRTKNIFGIYIYIYTCINKQMLQKHISRDTIATLASLPLIL
jgi:hypothetical protein